MGRKSVRIRVSLRFEEIGRRIIKDVKENKKQNSYAFSDLTDDVVVPMLEEFEKRWKKKRR